MVPCCIMDELLAMSQIGCPMASQRLGQGEPPNVKWREIRRKSSMMQQLSSADSGYK